MGSQPSCDAGQGQGRRLILTDDQDAFGRQLLDELAGGAADAVIERDDGTSSPSLAAGEMFKAYAQWAPPERAVFDAIAGRVLDVGCGSGRHSLEAQQRGHEVVAIDISPGAIAVSRARGIRDARLLALADVGAELGVFDTVLMLCGSVGLAGSADETERTLRRLHAITTPHARIVLDTVDPYAPDDDPAWPAYVARNRARGALPGQVTIRIRYGERVTPWFDLLLVAPHELGEIAERSGWRVATLVTDEANVYAVLEKRSGGEQRAI